MASASVRDRVETASAVIHEAGALALSYFTALADLRVETKANGQDVVSVADREVERLVRDRLGSAFPDDGFLGEEFGLSEGTSGFTWVIDPIDGTSCFVHGMRNWCVAIALQAGDRTVAGFILDPNADELFAACDGEGASLNGQPISVDLDTDLTRGLTSVGANFRVPVNMTVRFLVSLLNAGGMFVRSGSGALSLAHVACGRLAAYYEPHMNAWDCLAGQCLIREAGGWANDFLTEGTLLGGGRVIGCAPQVRDPLTAMIDRTTAGTAA